MSKKYPFDYWEYLIEYECVKDTKDLHVAVQLSKTLLDCNKELELNYRQLQNQMEDRNLEIEYLSKQSNELREVNETRLKLYEQLESNIQDLEREKNKLETNNRSDKRLLRNLRESLESFEEKCADLQSQIDRYEERLRDSEKTIRNLKSDQKSLSSENNTLSEENDLIKKQNRLLQQQHQRLKNEIEIATAEAAAAMASITVTEPVAAKVKISDSMMSASSTIRQKQFETILALGSSESNETEMSKICRKCVDSEELREQYQADKKKIDNLEDHIESLIKENFELNKRIADLQMKDDELKSLSDEILSIDVVQKGYVCSRCFDNNNNNNAGHEYGFESLTESLSVNGPSSSLWGGENLSSLMSLAACEKESNGQVNESSDSHPEGREDNEVDICSQLDDQTRLKTSEEENSVRLQVNDEQIVQKSNESNENKEQDKNPYQEIVDKYEQLEVKKEMLRNAIAEAAQTAIEQLKPQSNECSDGESSGYLDEEFQHKGTQTDISDCKSSFLFTVENGDENCKLGMIDSNTNSTILNEIPIHDNPSHKKLYREIFDVLKRAAKRKNDGEQFPLLEDNECGNDRSPANFKSVENALKVPPVTPASEIISMAAALTMRSVQEERPSEPCRQTDEQLDNGNDRTSPMAMVDECVIRKLKSRQQRSRKKDRSASSRRASNRASKANSRVRNATEVSTVIPVTSTSVRATETRDDEKSEQPMHSEQPSLSTVLPSEVQTVTSVPIESKSAMTSAKSSPSKRRSKRQKFTLLRLDQLDSIFDRKETTAMTDNSESKLKTEQTKRIPPPPPPAPVFLEYPNNRSSAITKLKMLRNLELTYAEVLAKATNQCRRSQLPR